MADKHRANSMESGGLSSDDIVKLESWISSARDYVVPTDDLRPRVLEAVSNVVDSRLQERRIGYAVIFVACLSLCWAGVWLWLTHVSEQAVDESATSISRRAAELHDQRSVNIHQATVDAYEEWRTRSQRSFTTAPAQGDSQIVNPQVTPGSLLPVR